MKMMMEYKNERACSSSWCSKVVDSIIGPNVIIGPNAFIEKSVISDSVILSDCKIWYTIKKL